MLQIILLCCVVVSIWSIAECQILKYSFLQQLSLVELNTGMDVLIIGGKGGYINSLVAILLTF